MTNLEVLQGSGALNYPIDESAFRANLTKNGLDPDAEFTIGNQKGIDLAISDLALTLIFSAKSISDDGYSVSLQDVKSLWDLRWYYRHKWGLPDDRPGVPKLDGSPTYKW